MTALTGFAPGKIILFGEHAVVYGQPAIAVPVTQVGAKAVVFPLPSAPAGEVWIDAPDIDLLNRLEDLPADHPFYILFSGMAQLLGLERFPALRLRVTSTIPVAAGMGSGAAVAAACARALGAFLGRPLTDDEVSRAAYLVEIRHHGTPSGIDNTVVSYAQPVYYVRGQNFERLTPCGDITLVVAHSGIASSTAEVVADLRARWQAAPGEYDPIFEHIGALSRKARTILESGNPLDLGHLMNANHALLQQLDVSCETLDRLVFTAREAGASGAKMSGAGRGGNMVALAAPDKAQTIAANLEHAGAVRTIITTI